MRTVAETLGSKLPAVSFMFQLRAEGQVATEREIMQFMVIMESTDSGAIVTMQWILKLV